MAGPASGGPVTSGLAGRFEVMADCAGTVMDGGGGGVGAVAAVAAACGSDGPYHDRT